MVTMTLDDRVKRSTVWASVLAVSMSLGCSRGGPEGPSSSTARGAPVEPAPATNADGPASLSPDQVVRTTVEEARRRAQAGEALLVCAYPDTSKYERNKLGGSISMAELESKAPTLAHDQELIFYCA